MLLNTSWSLVTIFFPSLSDPRATITIELPLPADVFPMADQFTNPLCFQNYHFPNEIRWKNVIRQFYLNRDNQNSNFPICFSAITITKELISSILVCGRGWKSYKFWPQLWTSCRNTDPKAAGFGSIVGWLNFLIAGILFPLNVRRISDTQPSYPTTLRS